MWDWESSPPRVKKPPWICGAFNQGTKNPCIRAETKKKKKEKEKEGERDMKLITRVQIKGT